MSDALDLIAAHDTCNLGTGASESTVRRAEQALGVSFPPQFREYLLKFNYAELYGDPLFGIHDEEGMAWCDVVARNEGRSHLKDGFLEFFANDLDGTLYIRLSDGGVVGNAAHYQPIAADLDAWVKMMLTA